MSFVEKSLQCSECGSAFAFTCEEQEFFASKGYVNEPKRCPTCRETRRTGRNNSSSFGGARPRTSLFTATCAECGKEARVPFEPKEGRPVYCSDCYSKTRSTNRR